MMDDFVFRTWQRSRYAFRTVGAPRTKWNNISLIIAYLIMSLDIVAHERIDL